MAQICRRCGSQVEDGQSMTVNLERVLGKDKYERAVAEGPDHVLTEAEKTIYSRTDAERTYCALCYYACHDRRHNIWECGVRHPINDPEPNTLTIGNG